MPDILTITLNPAVDISTIADKVVPEEKLRCETPLIDPGGGGNNVSRAIAALGGSATAFVATGGHTGRQLVSLLEAEGITHLVYPISGETRQGLAVTDRGSGAQYRFVMPGPEWTAAEAEGALAAITGAVHEGDYVVLSGSQPPGVPAEFAVEVSVKVAARGAKLIVDTSGAPLRALMQTQAATPYLLRLNKSESEAFAGRPLGDMTGFADYADSLIADGVAQVVILAFGPYGSVMANGGQRWYCAAPVVPVRSKVGAGDSFVGALTLAISRDEPLNEALQKGVAAASAAVMSDATRLCRREDAERLIGECLLREL